MVTLFSREQVCRELSVRLDIDLGKELLFDPVWSDVPFVPEVQLPYDGIAIPHHMDILSDKVMAIFKTPRSPDGIPRVTNRFKDMLDAVAISQQLEVDAQLLANALRVKAAAEGVDLDNLELPNVDQWRHEYGKEAVNSPELGATLPPFDEGYDSVRLMCRLALSGVPGTWNPQTHVFHPLVSSSSQSVTPRGSQTVKLADVSPRIAAMAKQLPHPIGSPYDPYSVPTPRGVSARRGR